MQYLSAVWSLLVTYWPVVLSVALPFVVAFIAKCSWSSVAKGWLAVVLSAALGLVGAFVAFGVPSPEQVVGFAAAALGTCQAAYVVFRSVGITSSWLDKVLSIGS